MEKMEHAAPVVSYKGEMDCVDGKYWLLNLDMVESQTGRIIEKTMFSSNEIGISTTTFSKDNVLYSKLRPYLNKVVLPESNGYCTTEILPLLPNKRLNKVFLAELLKGAEFVKYIQEQVAGTKMPRVQMTTFRNFQVILPPIELQNRFAGFVRQVDKSKFELTRGLSKLELLYKSLMQKCFRGELYA